MNAYKTGLLSSYDSFPGTLVPYRDGLSDAYKGSQYFYRKGSTVVAGTVTNWIVDLIMGIVHIVLLVGGVVMLVRSISLL